MTNGRYGDRIVDICKSGGIKYVVIPVNLKSLEEALRSNQNVGGVSVVHCETSCGLINPIKEIGATVKKHSKGRNLLFQSQ